ncbi:hypothetical protein GCM10022417_15560 [Corynebacterium pilbarense]
MTETPTALQHVELGVTGMTCSSCSSRVQRKLNKLHGVDASVNYSTETATVDFDPAKASSQLLIDEVRSAGYDAFEMTDSAVGGVRRRPRGRRQARSSKTRAWPKPRT